MKKLILFVSAVLLVCVTGAFAPVKHSSSKANFVAPAQVKVQPFCKFTYIDNHGRAIKLSSNVIHSTNKTLTFIFDGGEKLIISFTSIRAGHFVAESARSKDPNILFYPSPGSAHISMVGAILITSTKPVSGNFSHLVSDHNDEHITLGAGSFSF